MCAHALFAAQPASPGRLAAGTVCSAGRGGILVGRAAGPRSAGCQEPRATAGRGTVADGRSKALTCASGGVSDRTGSGARDAGKTCCHTRGATFARRCLAELVGRRGGSGHRSAGADCSHARRTGQPGASGRRRSTERTSADQSSSRAKSRAGAELGRTRYEPSGDAGPEDAEAKSDSEASTRDMASERLGGWPCSAATNWLKNVVPMPTMTANTITLMPDAITLPSTRSARKAVLPQSAKGTRTNPASVVSLNSRIVMKSWIARTKKASTTTIHANRSTMMVTKLSKNVVKPMSEPACCRRGQAA